MKTEHLTRLGKPLLCLSLTLGGAGLLQGCSPPTAGWNGIYAVDLAGAARTCVAPAATAPDGASVAEQIHVSNEGGWCGIVISRGGAPYASYLLVTRPAHGKVFAHRVGPNTRIDYTPDIGFTGEDKFVVRLIPGNATVEGTVTVTR